MQSHKIKFIALAVLLVAAPWAWMGETIDRAHKLIDTSDFKYLGLYGLAVTLSIAGLMIVPFLRNRAARLLLAISLLGGFCLDQIYRDIYHQAVTIDDIQLLWRERNATGDAVINYLHSGMIYGAFVLALGAAFALPPPIKWSLGLVWLAVPIGAFAAVCGTLISSKGAIQELPSPFFVPAGLVSSSSARILYSGPRETVKYDGAMHPKLRKVVLIVDESIRSDYMQLNSDRFDNTPELMKLRDRLANFGTAISSFNCSVSSRLLLRTGLQQRELPDAGQKGLRRPAIWNFAKNAGFKSIHIEAFSKLGRLHSFMNDNELKSIDEVKHISSDLRPNADDAVADALIETLKRDEPMFILVEKLGSHAPYKYYSPADDTYRPKGLDVLPAAADAKRRIQIEFYLKAVRWVVDRFIARVMPAIDKSDTLMIYTSDHGQSMYEGGYQATHCTNKNAHPGEGQVPLFAVTGNPEFAGPLNAEAVRAHDRATHYEIFPTLLLAMGYDLDWVTKTYGPSLLNVPVERSRSFLSTPVFRVQSEWTHVDKPAPTQ